MTHQKFEASARPIKNGGWRWVFVAAAVFVLSACGGGGGASDLSTVTSGTIAGKMQDAVVEMKPNEVAAIQVATVLAGNAVTLTGSTEMAKNYSEGQIVTLPPGTPNFPMGYAGRVVTKTDAAGQTTLQLEPATVPEVFKNLTVDFDTLRDDARIVAVIAPPGAQTKASFTNLTRKNQVGLEPRLAELKDSELGFKGDISTFYQFNENVKLTLTGKIDNLRVIKKMKYDPYVDPNPTQGTGSLPLAPKLSARADDYKELSSRITGDIGIEVKLEGETIHGDQASSGGLSVWDLLESNGVMTGLDSKDKKGLFPLAGLVIQPGLAAHPVLDDGSVWNASKAGIIVWLYVNLKGELTIKGDVTLINYKTSFDQSLSFTPISRDELEASAPRSPTPPSSAKTGFHGSADLIKNVGVTIAADLFVAGIRPLTIQFTPAAFSLNLAFSGAADYDWLGKTFTGSLCTDRLRASLAAQVLARAAIGVKIKNWTVAGGTAEYKHDFEPFWTTTTSALEGACIVSGNLDFAFSDLGVDPANPQNKLYEVDLTKAFENLELPRDVKYLSPKEPQVDWAISVDNVSTSGRVASATGTYKTVSGKFSGSQKFNVSLKPGSTYLAHLETTAIGWDFAAKSVDKRVTPALAPTVDFSTQLIANDCKRITLLASGGAGSSGETVTSWGWNITNVGTQFPLLTLSKPGTDVSLSACGVTTIKLTTTTNTGRVAVATKTIDTNQLGVSVTSVTPTTAAIINAQTTFTVTGQNLPLTAVMSIAEATCQTPINRTTTGFTVVCTLGGTAGSKVATIKTDLQANGGTVIDVSKTVTVSATAVWSSLLPNSDFLNGLANWVSIGSVTSQAGPSGASIVIPQAVNVNAYTNWAIIGQDITSIFTIGGTYDVTVDYQSSLPNGSIRIGHCTSNLGGIAGTDSYSNNLTNDGLQHSLSVSVRWDADLATSNDPMLCFIVGNSSSWGSPVNIRIWRIKVTATSSIPVVFLTDTGANVCYQAGSNTTQVSCTSAEAIALNDKQDGMIGRDVTNADSSDGKLGFSYSMVGSYAKTECVKDNITGLIWEGKPTSGLRINTATYTNYGDGRSGDASEYVTAVNSAALCGFTDWRLPNRAELQSLIDYGAYIFGPHIDSTWFPNTQKSGYWSSTGNAWVVLFGGSDDAGSILNYSRNNGYGVRLVR